MTRNEIEAKLKAGDFESCDWAHKKENRAYYNGETFSTTSKFGGDDEGDE